MSAPDAGEHPWQVFARIPSLAGRSYAVTDLPGGLTNRNYRLTSDDAQDPLDVVVRISDPTTGLLAVDRQAEYENSVRAAGVGVGAPVVDYLPGQGVLVVGYLPSRTFDDADVAGNLTRVAASVRRLHTAEPFVNRFDFFAVHRHYLRIMDEHGFRMPAGYLDLLPTAARVEAALSVQPEPLVSCHNDLLSANFLDEGARIRIIDYEYSGLNEPSFELGNIAQEAHLSPAQLAELVAAYHGGESAQTERSLARARLWSVMSAYGWTLWGTIQAGASRIDYDFWGWAMDKLDRAAGAMTSPGFETLLDEVAG